MRDEHLNHAFGDGVRRGGQVTAAPEQLRGHAEQAADVVPAYLPETMR